MKQKHTHTHTNDSHYKNNPDRVEGNDAYSKFVRWFVLEAIEILSLPKATRSKQIQHPPEESTNTSRSKRSRTSDVRGGTSSFLSSRGVCFKNVSLRSITMVRNFKAHSSWYSPIVPLHFVLLSSSTRSSRKLRVSLPFHKYAFASFSNIMSSWCQYEALKYVSFPTQVVSKSSKLIPVMIMGKILADKNVQART